MKLYKIQKNVFALTEQQIEKEKLLGWDVVEHTIVDNYDLVLFRSRVVHNYNGCQEIYQIGIQKVGMDFTDATQQLTKYPLDKQRGFSDSLMELRNVVQGWLNRYSCVFIGSVSDQKLEKYRRILTRLNFKLTPGKIFDYPICWVQ